MLSKLLHLFLNKIERHRWLNKIKKNNIVICPPFYILDKAKLIVNANIYIGGGAWMSLFGTLHIGDGTIIGPRLKVHTANHNYESDMLPYNGDILVKNVYIGKNVWIGADVTLLPGVSIGEGAVIGACSCITKNVPPFAVVGGNPARVLKYRDIENYNKYIGNIYFDKKKKGEVIIRIITTE